jgi:hypothetical protein
MKLVVLASGAELLIEPPHAAEALTPKEDRRCMN